MLSVQSAHNPEIEHHDMPSKTFDYPTMGMPTPGKPYNFNKVKNEEMKDFDTQFLDMFKPYNVTTKLFRTQTASMLDMVNQMKVVMFFAKIISRMLRASSILVLKVVIRSGAP